MFVYIYIAHDQYAAFKKHACVVRTRCTARWQTLHDHLTTPNYQVAAERSHVIYAAHYRWIRLEVVSFDKASTCVIARGILERGFRIIIVGAAVCAAVSVDKLARNVRHEGAVVTEWLLANRIIDLGACQIARFASGQETIV